MTRNRKKAYKQMARGRVKEVGGIMKLLRGIFIVKKADTRFGIERMRKNWRNRKKKGTTVVARLRTAAGRSFFVLKNGIRTTVYSAYMVMKGAASRLR